MESSSYYKGKMTEFSDLAKQLGELSDKISTCDSSVKKGIEYLGEILISGECIDKGVLGENVGATLGDIVDTVSTLISECNTKIRDYNDLYNAALFAEKLGLNKK